MNNRAFTKALERLTHLVLQVFYDAFTQYRRAKGQQTVTIALPVVLDVDYVADNNLSDLPKQTLGATSTMANIRTLVKRAVSRKPSPFYHDGKAAAFKLYLEGQIIQNRSMRCFHLVHAKERLKVESYLRKSNTSASCDMQSGI